MFGHAKGEDGRPCRGVFHPACRVAVCVQLDVLCRARGLARGVLQHFCLCGGEVITLTTIGYGDTFLVTTAGRMIAGGVAMLGIAVYVVPSGILASAFVEGLKKTGRRASRVQ